MHRRTAFPTAALIGLLVAAPSRACDEGQFPLFACEAAQGRKTIELCAASLQQADAQLQYRYGPTPREGRPALPELVFPADPVDSLDRFMAAVYTHRGVYTQQLRFVNAGYSYRVFSEARALRDRGAGVEVRHLASGKTTTIDCNERVRFFIFELQDRVACDPDTPVGRACVRSTHTR